MGWVDGWTDGSIVCLVVCQLLVSRIITSLSVCCARVCCFLAGNRQNSWRTKSTNYTPQDTTCTDPTLWPRLWTGVFESEAPTSHIDILLWQLSMSTLRLFGSLLALPTEHVIENLVLRNLQNRGYHSSPSRSDLAYLPKDKLLTDFAIRTGSPTPVHTGASNGMCNGGIGDEKRTGLLVDLGKVTDGIDLSQTSSPLESPLTSPAWLPSTPLRSHPSSTVSPIQSPGTESRRWSLSSTSVQQHLQTSFNATWPSLNLSSPAIGSSDSMLHELACMRIVCNPDSLETTVNGLVQNACRLLVIDINDELY